MQQITWPNDQNNKFLCTHKAMSMVLTTQHAFKHCKTTHSPPADSTRAATVLLKLQNKSKTTVPFQSEVKRVFHVKIRYHSILLFACLSCTPKCVSDFLCSLFGFVFDSFSLSSSVFSLYAVGWPRRRTVIDFVCTHASPYGFLFFFMPFLFSVFDFVLICCTRNATAIISHTNKLNKTTQYTN